ncbi:hypothetical protein DEMA109039_21915 [Deinococcus marmoris]
MSKMLFRTLLKSSCPVLNLQRFRDLGLDVQLT